MIKLIVSVDKNNGIGSNGKLLYRSKVDMEVFKKCTSEDRDRIILYGKNTLLSMPDGKPLPGRVNIVVTHNPEVVADEYSNLDMPVGILIYNNKYPEVKIVPINNRFYDKPITFNRDTLAEYNTWLLFCKGEMHVRKLASMGYDFWICGGESIYNQYLNMADIVVMTTFERVEREKKPTSFFDRAGVMSLEFLKMYSTRKRSPKYELQFDIFVARKVVENIARNYFTNNETSRRIAYDRFNEYEAEVKRVMRIIENGGKNI